MWTKDFGFLFSTILPALFTLTKCSKVLFVPIYGSHLRNHIAIGEKLSSLYHHEVHIAVPENQELPFNLTPLYYHMTLDKSAAEKYLTALITEKLGLFGQFKSIAQMQKRFCDAILKDHTVINEMISKNFDYLMVDSFTQCLSLLPKILKVPFSSCNSIAPLNSPAETGVPVSTSRTMLNPDFDVRSHLPSRIKNVFIFTAFRIIKNFFDTKLEKEYILFNKKYLTKDDISKRACTDLWIVTESSYFMEPSPRSPAIIPVGGALPIVVAKEKDEDLLEFILNSDNEIILVSFGSMVNVLPSSITNELLRTFEELPQFNFILKFDCARLSSMPVNVKCVSWMPQAEILRTNLTRLFITHGGSNSMHESATAGVPMIVIPFFGDQFYNAKLVEEKGLGKVVNLKKLKDLKTAILDVISNDSYKSNSVLASHIIHELEPDPAAKAAYYINHVMLYRANHFRSNAENLWLYQIYMYDIVALCLMFFLSCISFAGILLWKCLFTRIRQRKGKID